MGDEERCMEVAQEGEKEMRMVLHGPPIHPLPEEIKQMAHSETVCRYCGVSYLIYHEFHQLTTQLAQMEAELQELREITEREKAQRHALELGRLEWERALHLEMERQAKEEEKTREELENKSKDTERALREEFERKHETKWRDMKEEFLKIGKEKERQLERELGSLEKERLTQLREELERRMEEGEKVLRDALQKANKNSEELREYQQQLEERLAIAVSTKEEVERLLEKEKERDEILRGVCVRQQQALHKTVPTLHSCRSELTSLRGFLHQMTGAWQTFRSDILHHSTQVSSVWREELKHSRVGFQKVREEKESLTQQLREQRRQREEQLSQQKEHREEICRLKEELEEKCQQLSSCQQRCNTLGQQLLSWQQREEQINRMSRTAEEEVTQLREVLDEAQRETRQLRREREILIESHSKALNIMEENCRRQIASKLHAAVAEQKRQNALHLREQEEELRREAELELAIDREKKRLLLEQYQRDCAHFQQELLEKDQELRGLQQETRSRVEEERKRREELQRSLQQETLDLSRAKAELQQETERSSQLKEEVVLLQETVRRECEEREGLTAALCEAQQELLRLRSPASPPASSGSPSTPSERRPPQGKQSFHHHSRSQVPFGHSSDSTNAFRPCPAIADKRGRSSDGGAARRSFQSWNRAGGGRRMGTPPRWKVSDTASKVSLVMERKEML
ncbi:trichohyalin [Antennarius striatus]|uniref:trichohyalin n=1 Tax=Antennarius striatus TaxID=241820 RepID=UPI0035B0C5BC